MCSTQVTVLPCYNMHRLLICNQYRIFSFSITSIIRNCWCTFIFILQFLLHFLLSIQMIDLIWYHSSNYSFILILKSFICTMPPTLILLNILCHIKRQQIHLIKLIFKLMCTKILYPDILLYCFKFLLKQGTSLLYVILMV